MTETFGERVRRLRKARGMTTVALGQRCGAHNVSVHQWEHGACMPLSDKLKALATALGVTTDYLLTGREAPALAALHAAIRAGATHERLLAMVPQLEIPERRPCPTQTRD